MGTRRSRRVADLRFLAQPWRFDFEYSRAWIELSFPLYGVDLPSWSRRRMGGKGRGGRVPRRPLRWLPPAFWTRLLHLGVVVSGETWEIEVDSGIGGPATQWDLHAGRCAYPDDHRLDDVVPWSSVLAVDGQPVSFEGARLDDVWSGGAQVGSGNVTVRGSGVGPADLALAQIIDPAPYLAGQRSYLRGDGDGPAHGS